jgi:hypothetical protein
MDEKMEWDVGKPYIISMRTPWDILRSFFVVVYLMPKMQT